MSLRSHGDDDHQGMRVDELESRLAHQEEVIKQLIAKLSSSHLTSPSSSSSNVQYVDVATMRPSQPDTFNGSKRSDVDVCVCSK